MKLTKQQEEKILETLESEIITIHRLHPHNVIDHAIDITGTNLTLYFNIDKSDIRHKDDEVLGELEVFGIEIHDDWEEIEYQLSNNFKKKVVDMIERNTSYEL